MLDRIRVPAPGLPFVEMRYSALPREGDFLPNWWPRVVLTTTGDGWHEVDLSTLGLPDGRYEYELLLPTPDGIRTVADPYAEEITRFSGYRSVFEIRDGHRVRPHFSWEDELPHGMRLPGNAELVIYQLPMRWIENRGDDHDRQASLGTFDKAIFEHLNEWAALGINAIALAPVQDSSDTLNWGYGTRFFFAPDLDLGQPFDLKLFIKRCHQRGIRVLLDTVLGHSRGCPLELLAPEWFYLERGDDEPLADGEGRQGWGGRIFRYREPAGGTHHARELHKGIAEYWIDQFHIDGVRILDFHDIGNWELLRDYRHHAEAAHRWRFPDRPFLVAAEDSGRNARATQPGPHGDYIVNAIGDLDFTTEMRRLITNEMSTSAGEPTRRARAIAFIRGESLWNDWARRYRPADSFTDLSQRLMSLTAPGVAAESRQRLLSHLLGRPGWSREAAFEAMAGALALLLTAVGLPLLGAGEEFGDLDNSDPTERRFRWGDPVDWARGAAPDHAALLARVRPLIWLRRNHPALHRNEAEFFSLSAGFHASFDEDEGERVFAYCRTGGAKLGEGGQVAVVANPSARSYATGYRMWWPWEGPVIEQGGTGRQPLPEVEKGWATLLLDPYQVRVFTT